MINIFNIANFDGYDLVLIGLVLIVAILIIMKISRSIFDPWFPIGVNQAILLLIVAYLYIDGLIAISEFFYWMVATAALIVPLMLQNHSRLLVGFSSAVCSKRNFTFLLIVAYFLCAYQIIFDSIFILSRGIPVLNEYGSNPQIYIGGFGVVKYIHDAIRIVLPPIATYILLSSSRRKLYGFFVFCTFYPAVIFEWSKVGFITVAANYWICYLYFFGRTERLAKWTRYGFILAVVFVLFMFSRVAASGYGSNTLNAILIRLVETGDSVNMYYLLGAKNYIPVDYSFIQYVFSLVAGFFSVKIDTVGHVIQTAANISTEDGFGTSPPAQIIGSVFFGVFGIFYCLIMGLILCGVRRICSTQKVGIRILFLMLYIASPAFSGDLSLFFYYLFILLVVAPPILCAWLISKAGSRRWGRSVYA
jgi:hypothetical protein